MTVHCGSLSWLPLEWARLANEPGAIAGTVFLDEVGETPPAQQVQLLQVLQDHPAPSLEADEGHLDVRVLAATNVDLAARVRDGRFRADLYYRLAVIPLRVPSLREAVRGHPPPGPTFPRPSRPRPRQFARRVRGPRGGLAARSFVAGNVRELEDVVRRAATLSPGPLVRLTELQSDGHDGRRADRGASHAGRDRDPVHPTGPRPHERRQPKAARILGVSVRTLRRLTSGSR